MPAPPPLAAASLESPPSAPSPTPVKAPAPKEEPDEAAAILNSFRALEARFAGLRPHIEREICDTLGEEVWVYPGSTTGDEAFGSMTLGCVRRAREISICSRNMLKMRDEGFDVLQLLDVVLIHEAAHIYVEHRFSGWHVGDFDFDTAAGLVALSEGHAEWLSRRVSEELERTPTLDKLDAMGRPWRYRAGSEFFGAVVGALGYPQALHHGFADPPISVEEIEHPELYLARTHEAPAPAETAPSAAREAGDPPPSACAPPHSSR